MDTERQDLRQLQQQFAEYIVHGHNEALLSQQINKSHQPGSIERLTVYRNGYYVRLQDALANDFPALLAELGDTCFGKIMTAYLFDHPSGSPSLRQLGHRLSDWLKSKNHPVVWSEIAELEWAVLNAFDAPDADLLSNDHLSQIPADQWESLQFRLHRSVTLMSSTHNIREIWEAVTQHKTKSPSAPVDDYLVVWRLIDNPKVQSISHACYELLCLWNQNKSFGDACKCVERLDIADNIPRIAAECLFLAAQSGWLRGFEH